MCPQIVVDDGICILDLSKDTFRLYRLTSHLTYVEMMGLIIQGTVVRTFGDDEWERL
jgi:hypothetical protein